MPANAFDWIGGLPDGVRAAVLAESQIIDIPARTMVYQGETAPTGVYRLKSGGARMFFLSPSGREHLLRIYAPPETIGDLAAIDGGPRRAFVETTCDSSFEHLPSDRLAALRRAYPAIDTALVSALAHSLRQALHFIEESMVRDLAARVALRLHWLAEQQGAGDADIDLGIGQHELALFVGASRQSVNRALKEIERFGAAEARYGRITVHSLRKLQEFAASREEGAG